VIGLKAALRGNAFKPAIAFLQGNQDDANLTTYTFEDQNFGDPDATREIFVTFSFGTSSTRTPNSVTIGGVSATIESYTNSAGSLECCAHALVPTGTTGDISATLSGGALACSIGWSIVSIGGQRKTISRDKPRPAVHRWRRAR
jgi:hypothetical protein